ncbi:hypothetical protein RIF29_36669 [Crotalaria pallida]|uniref:Uncharacterized protein n=1 Tax=Crotalaria pallida TaxID=3830 RepID=A0AAN9EHW6_CROPI
MLLVCKRCCVSQSSLLAVEDLLIFPSISEVFVMEITGAKDAARSTDSSESACPGYNVETGLLHKFHSAHKR